MPAIPDDVVLDANVHDAMIVVLQREGLIDAVATFDQALAVPHMDASPATAETEQILLTLPRTVVRRAERVARTTRQPLELVLTEWLDRAASDLPVETLDDEELLALCEVQLSPAEQAELSALLTENSEGRLDEAGVARLDDRMMDHDRRLLRKSQALREAVARGLRGPLAA